jgi:ABC-type transport system involved in cytochrome c biogenesis permease subunit
MHGSPGLLRSYPQAAVKAARAALAEVKAAYLDRRAADRPARFSAAMDRFADAVCNLGEQVGPLRAKLPIEHRDQDLIAATAYPPPGATDVEVFYNRVDPFFWSWVVSLVATLGLLFAVGSWRRSMFWLGAALLVAAQAFTAAGLGLRGYVTGLVPLTGMFETVVFVALYAALLGLWFAMLPLWWPARPGPDGPPAGRMDRVQGRRPFALAGAMVSFLAAVLAYYAPATVMHRHLGSVAPILRDNFWLAVHVVTIMAGYASAAIALILGNIALGYYLLGRYSSGATEDGTAGGGCAARPPEACKVLAGFTYTAIQITVLLLAAGTILGALWADKAWGRFWAWDPKEVWALVSLLAYLGFLHARHIGWLGAFGMAMAAVLGACAVGFTWYGVNFLLGSGMHSYGSGAGGQWQVGTAAAVELLFLLAAAARYQMRG